MTETNSFVAVESYRAAAKSNSAVWNYKGLAIHALPEIHEYVGKFLSATLPEGSSVLDIAAGSGAMCLRLKDIGMRPTATDLVGENFRLHSDVDFVLANLNKPIPLELKEKFDCVVALEIIEHLENPRHFLRQCYAALRPGGMLVLSTPNIQSSISLAQFVRTGQYRWFETDHYERDGHITPLTADVLRRIFKECGFSGLKMNAIAPLTFPGATWWKMRLLAWMLRGFAQEKFEGDILISTALRLL